MTERTPFPLPSRRVMKVREVQSVEEMRELVQAWLDKIEMQDSWWMEARAALYRLAALAEIATEHGVPIHPSGRDGS